MKRQTRNARRKNRPKSGRNCWRRNYGRWGLIPRPSTMLVGSRVAVSLQWRRPASAVSRRFLSLSWLDFIVKLFPRLDLCIKLRQHLIKYLRFAVGQFDPIPDDLDYSAADFSRRFDLDSAHRPFLHLLAVNAHVDYLSGADSGVPRDDHRSCHFKWNAEKARPLCRLLHFHFTGVDLDSIFLQKDRMLARRLLEGEGLDSIRSGRQFVAWAVVDEQFQVAPPA